MGILMHSRRAVDGEELQARSRGGGFGGNGYMGLQFGSAGLQADDKPGSDQSNHGGH